MTKYSLREILEEILKANEKNADQKIFNYAAKTNIKYQVTQQQSQALQWELIQAGKLPDGSSHESDD